MSTLRRRESCELCCGCYPVCPLEVTVSRRSLLIYGDDEKTPELQLQNVVKHRRQRVVPQ